MQGDPLSPFWFIFAAEGLNMMFNRAAELGLVRGFKFRDEGVRITHLQIADDTLVFC